MSHYFSGILQLLLVAFNLAVAHSNIHNGYRWIPGIVGGAFCFGLALWMFSLGNRQRRLRKALEQMARPDQGEEG